MKPTNEIDQLTAVVNEMPLDALQELLELSRSAPIEITHPPRAGLTMMHVLDAFDDEFLLGEVLVTRAEVALDGIQGFGMVTGDSSARALARACSEVLLQGKDELLGSRVRKLLEREQEKCSEARRCEERLIASTKVNFDLMAGS